MESVKEIASQLAASLLEQVFLIMNESQRFHLHDSENRPEAMLKQPRSALSHKKQSKVSFNGWSNG